MSPLTTIPEGSEGGLADQRSAKGKPKAAPKPSKAQKKKEEEAEEKEKEKKKEKDEEEKKKKKEETERKKKEREEESEKKRKEKEEEEEAKKKKKKEESEREEKEKKEAIEKVNALKEEERRKEEERSKEKGQGGKGPGKRAREVYDSEISEESSSDESSFDWSVFDNWDELTQEKKNILVELCKERIEKNKRAISRSDKKLKKLEKEEKWIAHVRTTKLQITTKLTYGNYAWWLRDIEPYLDALRCGHIFAAARMRKEDPKYKKPEIPKEVASILYCQLRNSMSEEIKTRLGNQGGVAGNPEELLRFVQETLMPANVWTKHTLWEKFTKITLEDYSYVPLMLREMEDLREQADRMGFQIEEQIFVMYIMNALPDSYDYFKQLALHTQRDTRVSGYGAYNTVKEQLLVYSVKP